MRVLALLFLVAAAWPQPALTATMALRASADVGLPFWCDWGYDWDERCYRDDGPRLPVGGADDKVWRSALRFPVDRIPAGATLESARLRLFHDGTCVAPRVTTVRCGGRGFVVDVHRLMSADWFKEREPVFDESDEASAQLADSTARRWLSWDVTALVQDWHRGAVANDGLLLKLSGLQEDYDVSGPAFASSSFADVTKRPRLVVTYSTGP